MNHLLIIALLASFEAIGQTYQYTAVMLTHTKLETKEQIVDSLYEECGYFTVTDSLISSIRNNHNSVRWSINRKVLDLPCKCFYYFTEDDVVIVVNEPLDYIVTAFVTPNIVYMTTFYIKKE